MEKVMITAKQTVAKVLCFHKALNNFALNGLSVKGANEFIVYGSFSESAPSHSLIVENEINDETNSLVQKDKLGFSGTIFLSGELLLQRSVKNLSDFKVVFQRTKF